MSLKSIPIIGSLFGAAPPAAPAPPAPIPVPTILSPAVQSAGTDQATAAAMAAGRASTILTSGTGVASAPSVMTKVLLGGGG